MYKKALGIFLICSLGLSHLSQGQTIQDLIEQLQSTDPVTRSQAFYELQTFGYSSSDQIKVAIINLLTLENAYAPSQASLSEDYVTYYGDVVSAVAALNDIRALNALLDVIDRGNMAINALAGFGAAALDPVINKLNNIQDTIKTAAVLVLNKMLDPPNFQLVNDPISISKITVALEKAALDPNRYTSMSALEGLVKIGEPPLEQNLSSLLENGNFENNLIHSQWIATRPNQTFRLNAPIVAPFIVPKDETDPLHAPLGNNFVGILNPNDQDISGKLVHTAVARSFPPRIAVFQVTILANRGRLTGANFPFFDSASSDLLVQFFGWGAGIQPTINPNTDNWSRLPSVTLKQTFTNWAANGQWASQTFQFVTDKELSYISFALTGRNHKNASYVAFDVE